MASCMTAAVSLRAPVALRVRGRQSTTRACSAVSPVVTPGTTASLALGQKRSIAFGGVAAITFAANSAPTSVSRKSVVTQAAAKEGEESTANISRKVARTANACKTLGRWGFWSQLVLSTISAVILVFSFLFKGITKVRASMEDEGERSPQPSLLKSSRVDAML